MKKFYSWEFVSPAREQEHAREIQAKHEEFSNKVSRTYEWVHTHVSVNQEADSPSENHTQVCFDEPMYIHSNKYYTQTCMHRIYTVVPLSCGHFLLQARCGHIRGVASGEGEILLDCVKLLRQQVASVEGDKRGHVRGVLLL